jgi:hypothetical protein
MAASDRVGVGVNWTLAQVVEGEGGCAGAGVAEKVFHTVKALRLVAGGWVGEGGRWSSSQSC